MIASNDNGVGTSAVMRLGNIWDLEPDDRLDAHTRPADATESYSDLFLGIGGRGMGQRIVQPYKADNTRQQRADYDAKLGMVEEVEHVCVAAAKT